MWYSYILGDYREVWLRIKAPPVIEVGAYRGSTIQLVKFSKKWDIDEGYYGVCKFMYRLLIFNQSNS